MCFATRYPYVDLVCASDQAAGFIFKETGHHVYGNLHQVQSHGWCWCSISRDSLRLGAGLHVILLVMDFVRTSKHMVLARRVEVSLLLCTHGLFLSQLRCWCLIDKSVHVQEVDAVTGLSSALIQGVQDHVILKIADSIKFRIAYFWDISNTHHSNKRIPRQLHLKLVNQRMFRANNRPCILPSSPVSRRFRHCMDPAQHAHSQPLI